MTWSEDRFSRYGGKIIDSPLGLFKKTLDFDFLGVLCVLSITATDCRRSSFDPPLTPSNSLLETEIDSFIYLFIITTHKTYDLASALFQIIFYQRKCISVIQKCNK